MLMFFKTISVPAAILLLAAVVASAPPDVSNIVLTPGRTESELNFAWQTPAGADTETIIQVALKSDMIGADFPEDKTQTFTGNSSDFADGLISHKATVNGLVPLKSYAYRLGIGRNGDWSDVYEFSTRDVEAYGVLMVGDIQIGAKNIQDDVAGWRDTLEKALQITPDAAFILSVGDQVQNASSRDEYDGFLSLPQFKNLPFAPTIGNHDNDVLFSHHFNVPNESPTRGRTEAGGNYYFVYGDTLYMVVNSNNLDYRQHKAFIRDAVKTHPKARWKIVMMHHSIYGPDIARSATLELRENFVPIFDGYDIDVVLSGHDHIYVRTHFMRRNKVAPPLDKFPASVASPFEIPPGAVIKPRGALYLAAATSSGSKYYDPASQVFDYLAERAAPYYPMFSRINITNTSFEIISYKTDDMAVVDSFIMVKAAEENSRLNTFVIMPLVVLVIIAVLRFGRSRTAPKIR